MKNCLEKLSEVLSRLTYFFEVDFFVRTDTEKNVFFRADFSFNAFVDQKHVKRCKKSESSVRKFFSRARGLTISPPLRGGGLFDGLAHWLAGGARAKKAQKW